MQLVDGKSLRQLLDVQTRLSPELTIHIGNCVAAALDAERYLAAYRNAIQAIAARAGAGPQNADGISIKLSALHPRYEPAQHERVMAELLPRVASLVALGGDSATK